MVKKILSKRINFLIMKSLLITVLCTIGIGAEEQGKEKDIEVKDIQPEMVWELPIKGEEIIDVIFDEITMIVKEAKALGMKGLEQKKATEKVKVQYPEVVVTKKAVMFLNENKKIISQIPLKKIQIKRIRYKSPLVSLDTNRIILITQKGEFTFHLDCFDTKGNLVWQKRELDNPVFLSGNGKYLVTAADMSAVEGGGTSILYNKDGNELWSKKVGGNSGTAHILHNGEVLIFEFYIMDKTRVSLIDINGAKLWEKSLLATSDYDIFSTKDGKLILYAKKDDDDKYILYGFDKEGNLLWQPKKYVGFYNTFTPLSLSKDANYLIGYTLSSLAVMNINIGNFIWKYPLKEKDMETVCRWGDVKISSDGKYVLLGGRILLDGKTGKILKQIKERGKFLNTDQIWRKTYNKIEIFNISDLLKEKD